MNVSKIATQEYSGNIGQQPMVWPPNSEGFYTRPDQSTPDIIARIQANPSEQATYLNAVNHQMDEMEARTTANGGVMTAEDAASYRQLKTQMGTVMNAFAGPESKNFYDSLWFARDRAQKANPNDLDYVPMSSQEAMTHTRNNRPAQEEYLRDIDEELDTLDRAVATHQADDSTRKRYEYLQNRLREMRDANTEQPFDDELLARANRAEAGAAAVPRTEA